jgi:hypothetical protein
MSKRFAGVFFPKGDDDLLFSAEKKAMKWCERLEPVLLKEFCGENTA